MDDDTSDVKLIVVSVIVIAIIIFAYFQFINPMVYVWQRSQLGQAELAHAEYNRQIQTCEAVAKKESSKSLADAEVIRAQGVAEANKIIGDSLKGNEGYLRYLYINNLSESQDKTIIYIPTEAGLPIMESTRLIKE